MTEEARFCAKLCAKSCREWYQAFSNYGKGNEPSVKELLDAARMIESLSDMLELVILERDAAVAAAHGVCKACIHFNGHCPSGYIMSCCKFEECVYGMGEQDAKDHWIWRGV